MVADQENKKTTFPDFRPGDTVRVAIKVIEGESERLQAFEGTVISRRGHAELQSFTVRKISFGVGVERTFPLNSPHIESISIVKSGKVRRARLYYLRNLSGKAAKVDEREEQAPSAPASPKASSEKETKAEAKSHAEKKAKPASESSQSKAEPGAQAVAPARK